MRKNKYTRTFTVAFDQKLYDTIKDISDLEEVSMGEWIRNALSTQLVLNVGHGDVGSQPVENADIRG